MTTSSTYDHRLIDQAIKVNLVRHAIENFAISEELA